MTEPAEVPYDVHLFPVVRLKVAGIRAASHEAAIELAIQQSADELPRRFTAPDSEYSEEFLHYLVDVVGDPEYELSRWFYSRDEPLLSLLERLVAWHAGGATDDLAIGRLVTEAQEVLRTAV